MNEKLAVVSLISAALDEIKSQNEELQILITEKDIEKSIETPPDGKMGDLAFPCFTLAKSLRKAPPMIAADLKSRIDAAGMTGSVERVEAVGGYLNFFLDRKAVLQRVVAEITAQGENYAKSDEGKGKTVLVEFSSPNIAKPFHIGHLVSTALGSSLERIYSFLGYDTVKINHLGDWGTQFGKVICAYRHWGDEQAVRKDPINEILKLYVRIHKEAEMNPELDDESRACFKALEDGDEEVTALWRFFVDASLTEFNRIYDKLGISFDSYAGESFYSDKMPEVVQIMRDKGLLEESEGAQVVRFDEKDNLPPCIIIKSDGTTIYATRDIAAAIYRKRHYDFYKNIYVVGTPQALHFKQIFKCLDKMGFDCSSDCVHVGFGYVRFPDRVLSTRHGDVVLLEDVLKEAISKTKDIIEGSTTGKELEDVDFVAEKVGIGAVLYAFLKNSRERDIIFTWDDMLDFEGESGPYVQYAYARGKSILRKAEQLGIDYMNADVSLAVSDEEYALVKLLASFRDIVREAADKYEPCVVTRYITDVAQQFNKFYNNCSIMKADDDKVRDARMLLTHVSCVCIRSALHLIGIDVVEKM